MGNDELFDRNEALTFDDVLSSRLLRGAAQRHRYQHPTDRSHRLAIPSSPRPWIP